MSKFKDASENIKRLQVMFKGLIELSDSMDSLDSIENHINELESKRTHLLGLIDSVNANLSQAEMKLAKVNADYDQEIKNFEKIKLEQELSLSKAAEESKKLLSNKKKKNYKTVQKIEADSKAKVEAKKLELAKLDAELIEKTKKLEEVTEALNKIKGSF